MRAGIKIPKASAANEHTEAHALNTLGDDFYVRVCVRACVCVMLEPVSPTTFTVRLLLLNYHYIKHYNTLYFSVRASLFVCACTCRR